MAIQEYEVAPGPAPELSPLDLFKDGLHGMVMDMEDKGTSALGPLTTIRAELRARRQELMREFNTLDQRMRGELSGHDPDLMHKLADLQVEQISIYHQLVWVEGYIADRRQA